MQLTLSSTPFEKPHITPPSAAKASRPRDEAVLSQLDQIAEQNLQASRHGLGASAMFLALIGGLVVLGSASMWNARDGAVSKPAVAVVEARPAPVVEVAAAPAPPVVPTSTALEPTPQAMPEAVLAVEPMPAAEDALRKARIAKAAQAKRKAAQLAQERALAEEAQRVQLAQQTREAERTQQQAEQARQRAAAEQARVAAVQVAGNTRRSVGEACAAAGGFISQQFCQARECRKAEHQSDGICATLRETEAARLRASAER